MTETSHEICDDRQPKQKVYRAVMILTDLQSFWSLFMVISYHPNTTKVRNYTHETFLPHDSSNPFVHPSHEFEVRLHKLIRSLFHPLFPFNQLDDLILEVP